MNQDNAEIEKICELIELKGKVLEIGCGDGRLSEKLAEKVELTGIDPDEEAINEIKTKGTFIVGSGEKIPFPDDTFDIVLFSLSLHHHEHPDKALKEAIRVGKKIIIIEPVIGGDVQRIWGLLYPEEEQLRQTEKEIREYKLEKEETFKSKLEFDDEKDLLDYFYEGDKPGKRAEEIMNLIGDRLEFEDALKIYYIKKNSNL